MRCSVVIPCHNGEALTHACLESLLTQRGHTGATEILLVDNASDDGTAGLARLSPCIRVLRQERNLGFAGGVNVGIRAAREDLVLIVNNDTQAAPHLLHELADALLGHAGMGAVAPRSNHVKGHAQLAVGDRGRTLAGRIELEAELRDGPALQDVPTLAGLCLLLRRRTFAAVGLLDERFGHGNFEDDDLCLRLRLLGLRLGIAGRAFLHHEGHATFKHLGLDLRTELARRQAQFVAKWRDEPAGAAHVASLRGDLAGAAHAARAARHRHPTWPDADWHLGTWHERSGDPERAAVHFAALLRHAPHHFDARLALARCQLATGALDAGKATLLLARHDAQSPPQHAALQRTVAERAYGDGRLDDALAAFADALALQPGDGALHNAIGLCHLGAGRTTAAAEHFERAAAAGLAIAFSNLGICRANLGDAAGARAHFARAAELLPDDPVPRANLAACANAR